MFLGDWDRHEDQWRWEEKQVGHYTFYQPVPRDRDKVYYSTSGVLPEILSRQWLKSNLQSFDTEIRDVQGYNYNNRYFDRYFLTGLDESEWRTQIDFFEKTITDSLIRTSIQLLPDTIFRLSGEWIIETLIKRRQNLRKNALQYYQFISKYVDVTASDKNELINIHYLNNRSVAINIKKIKKDGTSDRVIFTRRFDPDVTKEIRLFGLAGDDIFKITGTQVSPIVIRLIGGDGRDSFLIPDPETKERLNIYDRSDHENLYLPGVLPYKLQQIVQ